MTELFSRTRAASGRAPTTDERLADLLELHAVSPGVTEATLGACTTGDGRTGYALLADEVPLDARVVLELGCGNGPLLAAVARARPGASRLLGVDLCASDLELARARLPAGRAELFCAPAQRLPLADASVDAALSHHAFYLFDPLEPAIAEVARVLRPGALFACVTWSFAADRAPLFAAMMTAFGALTARDCPSFAGWADRRSFDRAVYEGLLVRAGFAAPLEVDEHALELHEPVPGILDRLMRFLYSAYLQREETRAELRAEWTRLLEPTRDGEGRASLSFPFAVTRIRRR